MKHALPWGSGYEGLVKPKFLIKFKKHGKLFRPLENFKIAPLEKREILLCELKLKSHHTSPNKSKLSF
jgi:hypothetical protein